MAETTTRTGDTRFGQDAEMKTVMICTNGSPASSAAFSWAGHLAEALNAELVAVTVLASAPISATLRDEASRSLLAEAGTVAGHGRYRAVVVGGDPRIALPQTGRDEDAGIVVVGSDGSGWWPAVHLDHIAHRVAFEAGRPVAVIPASAPSGVCERLVVGADGSPGSQAALVWAAGVARRLGLAIVAVHAAPGPSVRGGLTEIHSAAAARGEVEQWLAPLVLRGVPYTTSVVDGDPALVIAGAVRPDHGDVMVLGERGGRSDHRLGSVALRVLHHAVCPVIVVPAPNDRR